MSSTPPPATLALPVTDDALAARLRSRMETVEALLDGHVEGRTAYVTEAARHLLAAGGKRFRPLLVLLAAEAGEPIQANLAGRAEMAVELGQVHLADQELRGRQIKAVAAEAVALVMGQAEMADLDILPY